MIRHAAGRVAAAITVAVFDVIARALHSDLGRSLRSRGEDW